MQYKHKDIIKQFKKSINECLYSPEQVNTVVKSHTNNTHPMHRI